MGLFLKLFTMDKIGNNFIDFVVKLRAKAEKNPISYAEITQEVEQVRAARYKAKSLE